VKGLNKWFTKQSELKYCIFSLICGIRPKMVMRREYKRRTVWRESMRVVQKEMVLGVEKG
jgi:hypothetical protein